MFIVNTTPFYSILSDVKRNLYIKKTVKAIINHTECLQFVYGKDPYWRGGGTGVSIIRAPFWMCKETMSKIPVNYEKNSYCQAISIDRRAHTFSIYTKSPFWLKTAEEGVATRISLSDTPLCETMCCALIYHPVGLFPSSQSKSLRLNS